MCHKPTACFVGLSSQSTTKQVSPSRSFGIGPAASTPQWQAPNGRRRPQAYRGEGRTGETTGETQTPGMDGQRTRLDGWTDSTSKSGRAPFLRGVANASESSYRDNSPAGARIPPLPRGDRMRVQQGGPSGTHPPILPHPAAGQPEVILTHWLPWGADTQIRLCPTCLPHPDPLLLLVSPQQRYFSKRKQTGKALEQTRA